MTKTTRGWEEMASCELAGPSDQLVSESVLSETLLVCFVPIVFGFSFLSSDCIRGEVRKDGVQSSFCFPAQHAAQQLV